MKLVAYSCTNPDPEPTGPRDPNTYRYDYAESLYSFHPWDLVSSLEYEKLTAIVIEIDPSHHLAIGCRGPEHYQIDPGHFELAEALRAGIARIIDADPRKYLSASQFFANPQAAIEIAQQNDGRTD